MGWLYDHHPQGVDLQRVLLLSSPRALVLDSAPDLDLDSEPVIFIEYPHYSNAREYIQVHSLSAVLLIAGSGLCPSPWTHWYVVLWVSTFGSVLYACNSSHS